MFYMSSLYGNMSDYDMLTLVSQSSESHSTMVNFLEKTTTPISWSANVSVNTLRPSQNGQHFKDDIFNNIFLNENVWILIKSYIIKTIPALVQIMA